MAKNSLSSGFAGFLIGVVTGLGIAAGAALFISNAPMPFVDKVDKVTADVDPAQKLAGNVDPNALLNRDISEATAENATVSGGVKTVRINDGVEGGVLAERDASGKAIGPGVVTPTVFWVQVAAYAKKDDAETTAASLAMMGIGTRVTQAGAFWRVRVGPFDDRSAAQEAADSLTDLGHKPVITEEK